MWHLQYQIKVFYRYLVLVSCLGSSSLEGRFMGQLSWEPPAWQLGAGQSWREALNADEMSLWKLERLRGLFLCMSVQVWVHGEAEGCLPWAGPWFSPCPPHAHFSLLPSHFIAARQEGCPLLFHLCSPSLPFSGVREPSLAPSSLSSLTFKDVPSLPWPVCTLLPLSSV